MENLRRQRLLWVLPLIAAFLVAVLFFGREILELFRPEFVDDGVPALRILAWPTAFSVLFSMAPTYLNYRRRNRLVLGTTAGATGVQVLLLVALVPPLGATGAALAYAVAMGGMFAVFAIIAHRELVALRASPVRSSASGTDSTG
jgi:O-antigen/teichoic acid export membrane protein